MPTDLLQQIICNIKIRRAPTRHDNIDFKLVITKTSEILPLSIVVGDRGYDSEENHIMVREKLGSFSVIPARNEDIPIWKTYGRYRKQMKRGYSKTLYHHRNKDETIISVIKRLFGEHITLSRLVKTQNRELSFRCIAYNIHRLTNLTIIIDGFYKADSIIFLDMNTPIQCLDKILRQTLKNNLGKISLSIPVPLSVISTIAPVFQLFFSFLH